jgi:hypothetical protein
VPASRRVDAVETALRVVQHLTVSRVAATGVGVYEHDGARTREPLGVGDGLPARAEAEPIRRHITGRDDLRPLSVKADELGNVKFEEPRNW